MLEKQKLSSSTGLKAMLLAAGLGTRFKPWTDNNPKALAIINGKTLLQRNVEYLQKFDIKDVVVNVHHFADAVVDTIEKNNGWGSNITISDERDELLETGGGILKAKTLLRGSPFITINVDILTDLNLKHFLSFHQQQNALISLAVSDRLTSRYLLFNKYGRLCGWRNTGENYREKIVLQAKDLFEKAYSGIAIYQPEVLDMISFTGKFSIIDVFMDLASQNKIAAYNHTGDQWLDVGRPESVPEAEQMFS
ncbi:MAG: nucleotidyltransferase family protein [Chitinophagaceae bacterium]